MEVLYHIRPYFGGIFPYIGLIYGRYLQFRFLEWPLTTCSLKTSSKSIEEIEGHTDGSSQAARWANWSAIVAAFHVDQTQTQQVGNSVVGQQRCVRRLLCRHNAMLALRGIFFEPTNMTFVVKPK